MSRSIRNTIGWVHRGDAPMVCFTFCKHISEGIFDALYSVYLIKFIYESIQYGIEYKRLVIMVSVFCLFHIIIHVTSAYWNYRIRIMNMKMYRYIFKRIMHKAKQIELEQYEKPEFYDNFSKVLDEALNYGMRGFVQFAWACGTLVSSITVLVIIAGVDPLLIVFVIPPVVSSVFFAVKESREEIESLNDENTGKRKMNYVKRVFYEKKYAAELRLFPMAHVLFKTHKEGYVERSEKSRPHARRIGTYKIIETLLFVGVVTLGSYLYITYRVKVTGVTAAASYIAMISAVEMLVSRVSEGIGLFTESGKYCMYMDYVDEFMNCSEEAREKKTLAPNEHMGDIEFRHVSFSYSGSGIRIIDDLNLKIHEGEHIALVGENGAGKTTFVKLLMGLYPLTEGEIYAGGNAVSMYDTEKYRDCFGTVFQDFQIFALPICENVLLRKPGTQKERQLVIDSLNKAQFGEVLDRLPEGIDTCLTKEFDDKGLVCSGGQKQKIAIARVFAKNSQVVILDEPSSALDPIAEYNMYCNMMAASAGKTVFFISHRMSSARMADRILFLEHGRIVEDGTHDELMAKDGRYAQMFCLQAKNYKDSMGGQLYETG